MKKQFLAMALMYVLSNPAFAKSTPPFSTVNFPTIKASIGQEMEIPNLIDEISVIVEDNSDQKSDEKNGDYRDISYQKEFECELFHHTIGLITSKLYSNIYSKFIYEMKPLIPDKNGFQLIYTECEGNYCKGPRYIYSNINSEGELSKSREFSLNFPDDLKRKVIYDLEMNLNKFKLSLENQSNKSN